MLLYNGLSTNVIPLSLTGLAWQNFVHDSAVMNQSNSGGFTKLSAYSTGLYFPHCMIPPRTAGRMVAHDTVTGTGGVSNAAILAVKLAIAALTGSGGITNAGASRIVQMIAAITGSGTVSNADLKAFLQAAASLTGSGTAAATITGLGALLAALTGSGTATGSTATGIGTLDADITVTGTGLSTTNVGPAVWAAIAASNNTPGSMGEKLNDAGSASNPWTEIIESGLTAAEILRIVASALAGRVSGAGTGTETFLGLDDTTERIISTVDEDGNRTAVDVDGA